MSSVMDDARQRYFQFGGFRLDTLERVLTNSGHSVPLTSRCYDLLLVFVKNGGHLLSHDELMRSVWNDTVVDRSSLKQTIAALRKTLGDIHEEPSFIQTVPRFGYRFVADVTPVPDESLLLVAERQSVTVVDFEERTETSRDLNWFASRLTRVLVAGLVALAFLSGGIALWQFRYRSPSVPNFLTYSWRALAANDDEAVAAIAPNGEFIIFLQHAEQADSLRMRRLAGTEWVPVVENISAPLWGLAISHDNNFVYYILGEHGSASNAGTLYRISVLGGTPRKILEGISGGPTLSPDDRRVAFIRSSDPAASQLVTADASDGSDQRVVSSAKVQPPLWNPAWSPDGKQIVCFTRDKRDDGSYYYLVEVPADGGEIINITQPDKKYIWWHSWLHDGSGLLAVKSDDVTNLRQLVFISYPDGAITKISNDLNQYTAMTASDDGAKIVTNRYDRRAELFVTDVHGDGGPALQLNACCPDTVTWLSDRQIVFDAFADGKRSLWEMNIDGSGQQQLFSTDSQNWSPHGSADGSKIVFLSNRSGTTQIWKSNSDGTKPEQMTNLTDDVDTPRFSRDGDYVYFSLLKDNKWLVARVNADGGGPQVVLDRNTGIWDISPNGKYMAYTYWPEDSELANVGVDDLYTGLQIARFKISPKQILRWTPDSRELIYDAKDPANPSGQLLVRQSVFSTPSSTPVIASSLVNYFLADSPDHTRLAFIRGRLLSSPAMLARK